jgi:oxygen-independent coproporphyrinogen-3 oxidase
VPVDTQQALEESFFLGLRLNRGVDLNELAHKFGDAVETYLPIIEELAAEGLLFKDENCIRLTPRGRLLSNEVFEKFIEQVLS